jgi:hypothetical protein
VVSFIGGGNLRDKNLLIEREWLTLGDIIGKGKQNS